MHRACWGGEQRHTDMVRALLEAGVPHDQPAADGKLPVDMVRGSAAALCARGRSPVAAALPCIHAACPRAAGARQQADHEAPQAVDCAGPQLRRAQGRRHAV